MGKPTIRIGENKGADQLHSNCEADLRLFCDCTAWFVSDLVGTQIVGFLMQRLKQHQSYIFSSMIDNDTGYLL